MATTLPAIATPQPGSSAQAAFIAFLSDPSSKATVALASLMRAKIREVRNVGWGQRRAGISQPCPRSCLVS